MFNTLETLVIQSEISQINLVERLIDDISVKYQLHDEVYGKIMLAVVEGVNNAIVHGNKMDVNKKVDIQYSVDEVVIEFIITDEGNGFDLNSIPDPTKPENIEKPHGRGVFLMTHLSDAIEFQDGGRKVSMKFNLL